jgi:hypothetical protein
MSEAGYQQHLETSNFSFAVEGDLQANLVARVANREQLRLIQAGLARSSPGKEAFAGTSRP